MSALIEEEVYEIRRRIIGELDQINERGMPAMHQARLADLIEQLIETKVVQALLRLKESK